MTQRSVLGLALATQLFLAAVAWIASRALGMTVAWTSDPARDVAFGLAGAGVLALANFTLLHHAGTNWLVDGVRAVYHELLVPLFARLNRVSIVMLGIAAGVGEEWLFRGVIQPQTGLVIASALFGAAHIGGRSMLAFGLWAAAMGLMLGALAMLTGGLVAPAIAHGVYDMLPLEYIRRGAQIE